MLAKRVKNLSSSITIEISQIAKDLKDQGENVLSFSMGEPDFDTPQIVKQAVIDAMNLGNVARYTPVAGTKEVLKAIQTKLKRDNNLEYSIDEIVVNAGAKHSLFNIWEALVEDTDEVIIPAPYWVTYPELTTFCGGTSVIIHPKKENDFKITAQELKEKITNKTKLLVLNSPSNPTGALYSKGELEELAKVLKDTKVLVVSDEIYEKIIYEGRFVSTGAISEDMLNRTITVNGLSKSAAMTGWRFGYLASKNKDLIKNIKKLQSQSTSNISSIVQAGAIPALLGKANKEIEIMVETFKQRRDYAVKAINETELLSVKSPQAAFYLFIDCSKLDSDSMRFCKRLLSEAKVAVVPGVAFGMEGYFRFSYASSMQSIQEGIERIANFVKNY